MGPAEGMEVKANGAPPHTLFHFQFHISQNESKGKGMIFDFLEKPCFAAHPAGPIHSDPGHCTHKTAILTKKKEIATN